MQDMFEKTMFNWNLVYGRGLPQYLGQDVVAIPMKGVFLPIKSGDVGSTFQGTCARTGQVLAHPPASITDTT